MDHLVVLAGLVPYLGGAYWVGRDAQRTGASRARWAAFTLLVWPLGIAAWLVQRRRSTTSAGTAPGTGGGGPNV